MLCWMPPVQSPELYRKSTATHLLRAGVDINTIRAWLGHVSINTTKRGRKKPQSCASKISACTAAQTVPCLPCVCTGGAARNESSSIAAPSR